MSEDSPADETQETTEEGDQEPQSDSDEDDDGGSRGLATLISAAVGLIVTALAYWWTQGMGPFFEELSRVEPTVEHGGVGSDWAVGNTDPMLDALIALVHAADVIMGVFILVMVFIHWAAFRRLASRMRQPDEAEAPDTVATDGGARGPEGRAPGRGREPAPSDRRADRGDGG